MKELKILLFGLLIAPTFVACTNDDTGSFPIGTYTRDVYANTPKGVISVACTNDWTMTITNGATWCTPDIKEGKGNFLYSIPVTYSTNTTHQMRTANFHCQANNNSDVKWDFTMLQYATRGDGSYGDAGLVSSIDGTDGSKISITYDDISRPTSIKMTLNETTLRDMSFVWSDSLLTINNSLKGTISRSYQPESLLSETDTVLYTNFSADYQKNFSFNVEDHRKGEYSGQGLYFAKQSENFSFPDNSRLADSLKYYHSYADGQKFQESLGIKYSDNDNRMQSVDVNQLLFGIKECSPYQLVGLFRRGRSTQIMSEAKSSIDGGVYYVSAQLNSDKSVHKLTVTDKQGNQVVYTFTYTSSK